MTVKSPAKSTASNTASIVPRKSESAQKDLSLYRVIGIDPGKSGGIAIIDFCTKHGRFSSQQVRGLHAMPDTEADTADLIRSYVRAADGCTRENVYVYMEHVHFMPMMRKQSGVANWNFGVSYGTVRGILAGAKLQRKFITASLWQKRLSCRTKGNKNVTKTRAQELFPQTAGITLKTADALLVSLYGVLDLIQIYGLRDRRGPK